MNLKDKLKSGLIWTSLVSIVSLPLVYYRNWILGQVDIEGNNLLGVFAGVMLFINTIITFGLYGGESVLSHYLPKIKDGERINFVRSYQLISLGLYVIFITFFLSLPSLQGYFLKDIITSRVLFALCILGLIIVYSQVGVQSLRGFFKFEKAAIYSQFQIVFVSFFATLLFLLINVQIKHSLGNVLMVFITILCASNLLMGILSWRNIGNQVESFKFYLPKSFWKYSSSIHLNTVLTYFYQSIDQFIVISHYSLNELGAYFFIVQLTELIRYIPSKLSQVFLASFSSMVAENAEGLKALHRQICVKLNLYSSILSIIMICLGYYILKLTNEDYLNYYNLLLVLTVGVNLRSVGSVNSMLMLSKGIAVPFVINNFVMIAFQLISSIILIEHIGIMGVAIGKFIAIVSSQVGTYLIFKYKIKKLLPYNKDYFIGQAVVILVAFVFYHLLN